MKEKKKKNRQRYYHFTYSQVSNKRGGQNKREAQRFFLDLTKRGQSKCGGQSFSAKH